MKKKEIFDQFVVAYNNFDSHPLTGETMAKFYLEDIAKEYTHSIINTIRITALNRKLLVFGHRGCGKSTILNKVAEELQDKYHVVSFSASEELNMMDVETIDILMTIFVRLLSSMKDKNIESFKSPYKKMLDIIKEKLKIQEGGINLLSKISLKIKVEHESRSALRKAFKTQIDELQSNIESLEKITSILI